MCCKCCHVSIDVQTTIIITIMLINQKKIWPRQSMELVITSHDQQSHHNNSPSTARIHTSPRVVYIEWKPPWSNTTVAAQGFSTCRSKSSAARDVLSRAWIILQSRVGLFVDENLIQVSNVAFYGGCSFFLAFWQAMLTTRDDNPNAVS